MSHTHHIWEHTKIQTQDQEQSGTRIRTRTRTGTKTTESTMTMRIRTRTRPKEMQIACHLAHQPGAVGFAATNQILQSYWKIMIKHSSLTIWAQLSG